MGFVWGYVQPPSGPRERNMSEGKGAQVMGTRRNARVGDTTNTQADTSISQNVFIN